jgi:hypothetical protein
MELNSRMWVWPCDANNPLWLTEPRPRGGLENVSMNNEKAGGQPPMDPEANSPNQHNSSVKKRPLDVKDHIGRQLRALYDGVASQPVPDRFMDLLNRLDEKSRDE